MFIVTRALFYSLLLAWSVTALAQEYPIRNDPNTEIIHLQNPDVDFALRARLISRAKKSVRMINFLHGADEVGMNMARAMRTAANNGVEIQYVYEGSISRTLGGDITGKVARVLTDSNLRRVPEVITARTSEKKKAGWAINDYIHEKLIIIDEGTPDEVIFIGGRGATQMDTVLLDAGYLIRPIDPSKPYLGNDLSGFFKTFWAKLKEVYTVETPHPLSGSLAAELNSRALTTSVTRADLKDQFDHLANLIDQPALSVTALAPEQFRPPRVQLVGNNFLNTMLSEQVHKTIYVRPEMYNNPLIQKLIQKISQASDIELTSYSIALPEPLEDALAQFTLRGGRLELFTNGRKAHAIFSPLGLPADYTFTGYLDLMAKASPQNVTLNFLVPQAAKKSEGASTKPVYVHRKRAVIDDTVVVGSDNFTPSSASKNDEFMIFIDDPRMAMAMRAQSHEEKSQIFEQADVRQVQEELKRTNWLSRHCMKIIGSMY